MGSETETRHVQTTEYMLSGLIRCVKCGSAFTGFSRTNKRGYKHRYYGCSNKQNRKGCDCKNINADELELLINYTLRNEILNENLIERTADKIIEVTREKQGTRLEKHNSITKEISDASFQIDNLVKVLSSGLDSNAVREKITDLERRKSALEHSLQAVHVSKSVEVDRDKLIAQLKKDTVALMETPEKTKELVRKYITKIIISDDTVEVTALSDIVSNRYSGRGI